MSNQETPDSKGWEDAFYKEFPAQPVFSDEQAARLALVKEVYRRAYESHQPEIDALRDSNAELARLLEKYMQMFDNLHADAKAVLAKVKP